jgi:DNA-binding transcriptional MerR regulator
MKIQEVCKRTGIARRTIHFYIKEELITPSINNSNGYYDFTEDDCRQLILIREYRKAEISLSVIKSLIKNPITAGFYLNLYVKKLNKKKIWIEETTKSIHYILENLPIKPDFSTLYTLSIESGIPDSVEHPDADSFDTYNNTLVNRFLWSSFLPDKNLTEYQQFLWIKLNHTTNLNNSPHYHSLNTFLQMLKPKYIDQIFVQRSHHYEYVASLDTQGCRTYAEEMKDSIELLVRKRAIVEFWKQNYETFILPNTFIFSSALSNIVAEMSPFFSSYRDNILLCCDLLYQWLHSVDGKDLLAQLNHTLKPQLDLSSCNHGQLEALAVFTDLFNVLTA